MSVTDYAPSTAQPCPDISTSPLLRCFNPRNQSLHPQEQLYVDTRAASVLPTAWSDWLADADLGYDFSAFRNNNAFPKVGIAIPGGGLRAAQYGAACLHALDARNQAAKRAGTGGLLQVASYITGLSGGSWLTGSLLFNNWPNIDHLVLGDGKSLSGWMLDIPFVTPDGLDILSDKNQAFYGSLLWSVIAKSKTGIDTSLTDVWSRIISYHFLNQTSRSNFFTNDSSHGAGQLWSDIPRIPVYQQHLVPFPIVVADSRKVGTNLTTILPLDSVVYEITPLELASYDPSLSCGMNLTYAGTHLVAGRPSNGSSCTTGFDQAGFIMGTSASLFNQILDFAQNTIQQFSSSDSAGLLHLLGRQLREVRTRADDVANWPNPFQEVASQDFQDVDASWIELIDGASNQENIPYGPLLVKARNLDVIVTVEGSADDQVNNWPNGTGLIFSSARQAKFLQTTHQPFPPIPSTPEDFIATGVNARPTFFGCGSPTELPPYPLVIYLPNAPPINGDDPVTNTATFQLTYTLKHMQAYFKQVFDTTVSGFVPFSNEADSNWGKCLQCAALDRGRFKVDPVIARSSICTTCFEHYCYDSQHPPTQAQLPNRKLVFVDPDPQGFVSFAAKHKYPLLGGILGLFALVLVLVLGIIFWRKHIAKKRKYQQIKYTELIYEDLPDHLALHPIRK